MHLTIYFMPMYLLAYVNMYYMELTLEILWLYDWKKIFLISYIYLPWQRNITHHSIYTTCPFIQEPQACHQGRQFGLIVSVYAISNLYEIHLTHN